ncbi:hypothetical protein DQE80_17705, partial [Enterococcus sp. HPCN18]
QQFPAAEQIRLQAQAQEARCLRTGVGMLQVDVHGADCIAPGRHGPVEPSPRSAALHAAAQSVSAGPCPANAERSARA